MNERTRAWIYRVLVAAVPVATYYGVIKDEAAPVWLGLAAAVFGFGLASANTSTKG